jgi:hypothetical protein
MNEYDSAQKITPPNELTWADVEREALYCPVLQRMCHLDAIDGLTREQVMLWTLIWFSRKQREMLDRETKRLMNESSKAVAAVDPHAGTTTG